MTGAAIYALTTADFTYGLLFGPLFATIFLFACLHSLGSVTAICLDRGQITLFGPGKEEIISENAGAMFFEVRGSGCLIAPGTRFSINLRSFPDSKELRLALREACDLANRAALGQAIALSRSFEARTSRYLAYGFTLYLAYILTLMAVSRPMGWANALIGLPILLVFIILCKELRSSRILMSPTGLDVRRPFQAMKANWEDVEWLTLSTQRTKSGDMELLEIRTDKGKIYVNEFFDDYALARDVILSMMAPRHPERMLDKRTGSEYA